MKSAPVKIGSFKIPHDTYITFIMEAFLVLTTFFPDTFTTIRALHDFFGMQILKGIWVFMLASHALEALFVVSLCRKHVTGWAASVS